MLRGAAAATAAAGSCAEPRRSFGLNRVPSAKETDGRLDLALLEVRGMLKLEAMSSLLKPERSNMLHFELISWNSTPAAGSASANGEVNAEVGKEEEEEEGKRSRRKRSEEE